MRAASMASRGLEFGREWEGQTVDGRIPLQRYLGGSASSAVFQTQHRNAKAAIKLRKTAPDEAEAQLARWRKAAELSHPNLVRIFEVGRCWLAGGELTYIVTECAEENLSEVLPRRALTIDETEQLLRPALDVLRFLHQRGMVHSRIRPSNVMSVSEQLKLSSDDIRVSGKAEPPVESSVYDAPEARDGSFSVAADVWSLGITLAEALTQRAPSTAADVIDSGLPQPFADIVQHCLRQNPTQRWTPKEIAERLQGRTEPRLPAPQQESPRTGMKLGSGAQISIAVAALVALAGVYAVVHRAARTEPNVGPPVPAQSATVPEAPPAAKSATGANVPARSAAANATGAVVNRVLPDPSASARRTIHGIIKVRVKVNVDGAGNVTNAKFVNPGPSKYFSRLSMEAARQWKFTPPPTNGQPGPSEWTLLFEFSRSGTQAIPQESR